MKRHPWSLWGYLCVAVFAILAMCLFTMTDSGELLACDGGGGPGFAMMAGGSCNAQLGCSGGACDSQVGFARGRAMTMQGNYGGYKAPFAQSRLVLPVASASVESIKQERQSVAQHARRPEVRSVASSSREEFADREKATATVKLKLSYRLPPVSDQQYVSR